MLYVPVFYATTHGHTQTIAELFARILFNEGLDAETFELGAGHLDGLLDGSSAVVVGASVYNQRHQRVARRFVRRYRHALQQQPSLWFSVSLSATATVAGGHQRAMSLAERFAERCHWCPDHVVCFGGALAYTRCNWPTRRWRRRAAATFGAGSDTARDEDLTAWDEVEAAAVAFAEHVRTTRHGAPGTGGAQRPPSGCHAVAQTSGPAP